MNAFDMARTAYSSRTSPVRTDRGTEYEIFARITHQLRASCRPDAPIAERVAALHENRKLWITLATATADDDNALPQELRARLFYLAEFTIEHTRRALRGEAEAGALVDINSAVMKGLRASGAGG